MILNKIGETKNQKILLCIIFALGWFALITQLYVAVDKRQASVLEAIIRFFSFFTILTNLLVAACCTILLVSRSKLYQFFARSSTLTAITVYILIVGIIYNLLLRSITHASGISEVDNEIFHVVVPLLFFLYWFIYVPKAHLDWQYAFAWLAYPVVYVMYTLLHGFVTNFYPYPFINAYKLGYAKTLINGAFVLIAFFVLSILLISVKSIHKKSVTD